MGELNPKQRRFVAEYLIDTNATQAAIRAGYSQHTARQQGDRLLSNADIAALVAEGQAKLAQKAGITAERVIAEMAAIGFADMRHYLAFTEGGDVLMDWSRMPAEATKAVAEVTQETYMEGHGDDATPVKRTKFKLHNKLEALKSLGTHLGLFAEKHKHEHSGKVIVEYDDGLSPDSD